MTDSVNIIADIIGWLYFVSWSVSFYPQVWVNYKRKSVEGLSFDFLIYNITGYIGYSIFNCTLFWSHTVKQEYHQKFKNNTDPVEPNDIAFALHATFITIVTIAQCFIYERGNQKNSKIAIIIVILVWGSEFLILFLALAKVVTWLFFVYWFSYVKLLITLLKYIPQAYMNFKRKSTTGWSIGNVLLDFSGGVLSFLQMFVVAFHDDDWEIFYGNPTKLGLSIISILFDILFIIQHYFLYPSPPSSSLNNNTNREREVLSPGRRYEKLHKTVPPIDDA